MTTLPDYTVTSLPRVMTRTDADGMYGDAVPWREPDITTATVATNTDHEPIFAYLPVGDMRELRHAVLTMKMDKTRRWDGTTNASRVFGNGPRKPIRGREGCNSTSFAADDPTRNTVITSFATRLTTMLAELFPTIADHDQHEVADVLPEWKLGETNWTSGVVNQSSALPYHRDAFNFDCWTAMPVLRRGMTGGYLHIPEYDVTIASRDGWAVFFPGYDLLHGVTPMHATRTDGYRYSVVYYALKGMKDCFTHAVEAEYARRKRTERERDMAHRIATGNKDTNKKAR